VSPARDFGQDQVDALRPFRDRFRSDRRDRDGVRAARAGTGVRAGRSFGVHV
jgi:hypothetical protein